MTSLVVRPGVSLRRSADRENRIGRCTDATRSTRKSPAGADTHHGVLVVNNHDTIAPRSGFETHPHRNMEIVTWVLNGSLVHQDSEGNTGIIYQSGAAHDRWNWYPALGEERPFGRKSERRPTA